ncbi:putative F-box/LRR-repeat protein 23 [Tanacetum coccineum]
MSPPPYQSQTSQALSLVHHFDLDDDFDPFFCSRAYFTSHGLGGPSVPVQDDSPSEEMVPILMMIIMLMIRSYMTDTLVNSFTSLKPFGVHIDGDDYLIHKKVQLLAARNFCPPCSRNLRQFDFGHWSSISKNFVTFSFEENNEAYEVKECGARLLCDGDSQDVTNLGMFQDLSQHGGAMNCSGPYGYSTWFSSALRYLKVKCNYDDEYQTIKVLTESLMKFPLLEELSLHMIRISKETIETVGRHCPKLKTLKVNQRACKLCVGDANEERLTSYNEIAVAIGGSLHELRHLELIGNKMLNFGLQVILDGCRHLETLDLRECFYIDLKGNPVARCIKQINHLKLPTDSLESDPCVCVEHDTSSDDYHDDYYDDDSYDDYYVDDPELYAGYISQ